ncbi:hypothetical protein [Cellulosimicrobium cellulans]|uniref:hypothetical protein n=1 Tax=Cellulosimicrobium cellulans TaxID=1710 RepID=UPI001956CC8E|nr:hypothetical protein [Cellulosimicrobium cellulans]
MPSSTDNLRADVASGEYLVNADATAKNRQLLDAINQGRQPVLPQSGVMTPTSVSLEGANITIEVDGTSFRGYVRQQARVEATSAILTAQKRPAAR